MLVTEMQFSVILKLRNGGKMKRIVVLAKQVPDTANVTGDAMKEDGTVNRAALPAVYNPEDLNALEMALQIKEKIPVEVTVITMGPPKALEVLKQSLFMGADKVKLITDRRFAAADTLATSYVLAETIKHIGNVDLVIAGRQAIDGDTAQVGPQTADKIGFNQISYVSELREVTDNYVIVERDGELQTEVIKSGFPLLMTVTSAANEPRYANARLMLKYFKAELPKSHHDDNIIDILTLDDLNLDIERCGLKGSPTKVHKIKSITLKGSDLKMYQNKPAEIKDLSRDIMRDLTEVGQ